MPVKLCMCMRSLFRRRSDKGGVILRRDETRNYVKLGKLDEAIACCLFFTVRALREIMIMMVSLVSTPIIWVLGQDERIQIQQIRIAHQTTLCRWQMEPSLSFCEKRCLSSGFRCLPVVFIIRPPLCLRRALVLRGF